VVAACAPPKQELALRIRDGERDVTARIGRRPTVEQLEHRLSISTDEVVGGLHVTHANTVSPWTRRGRGEALGVDLAGEPEPRDRVGQALGAERREGPSWRWRCRWGAVVLPELLSRAMTVSAAVVVGCTQGGRRSMRLHAPGLRAVA
jgi:hypothetical protein